MSPAGCLSFIVRSRQSEGDTEALKMLIQSGLSVDWDWGMHGGNLMTNAVQFGQLEVVKALRSAGASVDRDPRNGRSPLYAAVVYSEADVEAYLRREGAHFNQWDREAFESLGMKVPE